MLISSKIAATGRVATYLDHPERGTYPVSCTVYAYSHLKPLFESIKYIDVALRGAAGINMILDGFRKRQPLGGNFYFYLPTDHPDYDQLTPEQRERWTLPVDNVIVVADSMEEGDGDAVSIQESWRIFIEQLEAGKVPLVDLSRLRPSGSTNAIGLTASGPVSFLTIYEAILHHLNTGDIVSLMQMYGQFNEVLRRGGCITADTWISTIEGPRRVSDLVGVQFTAKVNGLFYPSTEEGFFSTGTKEVYEVVTSGGHRIKATANHPLCLLRKGKEEWVPLEEAKVGDTIFLNAHRTIPSWDGYGSFELGWLLGQMVGDGCICSRPEGKSDYAELGFWGEYGELQTKRSIEYLNREGLVIENREITGTLCLKNGVPKYRVRSALLAAKSKELGVYPGNKTITPEIEQASSEFYIGFLQALFDSDGTVRNAQEHKQSRCIVLAQSNVLTLQGVQRMLGRLGINSNIYTNSKSYDCVVNGYKGIAKIASQLVISRDNIEVFESVVGFSQPDKIAKLRAMLLSYTQGITEDTFGVKIKSIELVGEEETFDCTIPEVHEFDGNGFRLHNSFKNGIITYSLYYKHTDIIRYLNTELAILPGSAKKSVRIDEGLIKDKRITGLLVARLNDKSSMIEKLVFKVRNPVGGIEFIRGKSREWLHSNGFKIVEELYSNVCLAGDTLVATRDGHFPIKDLVGREVEVWDGERWLRVNTFRKTGEDQELYRVELEDGRFIRATALHEFILVDGSRKQLIDLEEGDLLKEFDLEGDVFREPKNVYNAVKSITVDGREDVYCCTVPSTNSFLLSNGIHLGQCKEVHIAHRGTCLLLHVNLGQINTLDELTPAFIEGANLLIHLYQTWKGEAGEGASQYLSNEEDKQVGLGVIGLANLLSHLGITYKQHVEALESCLEGRDYDRDSIEWQLAKALRDAYEAASELFIAIGLERGFVVAPTQSSGYRYKDTKGHTTCKNIFPPLARRVRRTSHTVKDLAGFYYHGDVETIQSVVEGEGARFLSRLVRVWQMLMDSTGLAHSISHDLYYKVDEAWLVEFIEDPYTVTTYYQLSDKVDGGKVLNKGVAVAAKDTGVCAIDNPTGCISCAE